MNQAISLTTQSVRRSPSPSKAKIDVSAEGVELVREYEVEKQHW